MLNHSIIAVLNQYSVQRLQTEDKTEMEKAMEAAAPTDYEVCLACQ